MNLKIKALRGEYALRAFDKDGNEIFYTSTRLGGLVYEKDSYNCVIPDNSVSYELYDFKKNAKIKFHIKEIKKNVSD